MFGLSPKYSRGLKNAIAEHYPNSKCHVEGMGANSEPTWFARPINREQMSGDDDIPTDLVWHQFDRDDAPSVLTCISEECQHEDCSRCPGFFEREHELLFCVHACHSVPSIRASDSQQ
jgi:hypothetical protein